MAQTPLIAASQAGAGKHPNNPGLGSAPSRAGKWFSAESHPSLHPVILTNYGNRLWMEGIDIPQSPSLRPPGDSESDGRAADCISQNISASFRVWQSVDTDVICPVIEHTAAQRRGEIVPY